MNKFFDFLVNAGYHLDDRGKYWRTCAHYRGGKNPTALSIDKDTGFFRDFATGDRGPFKRLVQLIGGEIQGADWTPDNKYKPKDKVKTAKYYPHECLKKLVPHLDLFVQRGISKETLEIFEAGLAHSGKQNRRICFPIYDQQGRIIGFDGRWYAKEAPNKKVAKWKKTGIKTDWIYPCHLNKEIIEEKKEIILVESIGDILALWDAGIKTGLCIFGTELSSKLLIYILGRNPDKVIIATNNEHDNDSIGNLAAQKIQLKLSKFLDLGKIKLHLPFKKDFGEMTKQEILRWYESARA